MTSSRHGRPLRGTGGFTLVEMVIALALAGVVGTLIFQLLSSQGRFAEVQSAREEVQQNARAALDVLSSEIRAAPQGGLRLAEAAAVRLRVPYAWGVLCGGGDRWAVIALPDVLDAAGAFAQIGLRTRDAAGDVTWTFSRAGATVAPVTNDPACAALQDAPSGSPGSAPAGDVWQYRVDGDQFNASTQGAGALVMLTRMVQYDLATSEGYPGLWVRRTVGPPTGSQEQGQGGNRQRQPLAGPVATDGLSFEYFAGTSAVPLTPPLTELLRDQVTRIRITVRMQTSRASRNEIEEASTIVHLRNRL
jgi:prepilin-type N-terminal cleavage/methylation domain-containing protein